MFRPGNRWDLGAGVRASTHLGTAAEYTARQGSLETAPTTLSIDPSVYALNLAVFGEVRLSRWVALGANLDLIGAAAGSSRTVGASTAKPESFSYFSFGTRDHGSLDSEFYVAVRIANGVRLRAGASHYVTDYIVTGSASSDTRYQRFDTVAFVAVGWRP